MNEQEMKNGPLSMTREELLEIGAVVAYDPDEADELGAFTEDAIDEDDALEGRPV